MTETTAYLADGRSVEVPEDAVKDWQYLVQNSDTTLGLADWYTEQGDEHQDEIEGEPHDHPRCDHDDRTVRVTNMSQRESYDRARPHASAWVCARRACVLDAMAWVEHSTNEQAVWQEHGKDAWHAAPPLAEEDAALLVAEPLSANDPRISPDESGQQSFVVFVDTNALADAYASRDPYWDHHDIVHAKALAFGSPYGSTVEVLSTDPMSGTSAVRYTTGVAEALEQHNEGIEEEKDD